MPTAVLVAVISSAAAVESYQVRELMAALLLFSILFGVLGLSLLVVYLVEEAALKGANRLETHFAYIRGRHDQASNQRHKNHAMRLSP